MNLLKQSLTRLPSSLLNAISKKQIERERYKAINDLKTSRENLRALSAHLQSVREEERTRIAREIHDELGQMLTALKMDVLWLHGKISALANKPVKQFDETIKSMTFLIDSTINSVRRIATDLRPGVLDDLGLVPAIEWQSQEFEKRTGILTKFSSSVREANIERERSTAIFRILQEALTNVVRHSKASKLYIRFEMTNTQLILTVEDNGRGIRSEEINSPRSLGLLGMGERAELQGGSIDITGQPNEGTSITVSLPRTKGEEQKQRHD
ncbi:MAG: sensor histidine kinase [Ignavibacteriales bacterium]|nr:sensor histidine kinase [Ignavibacteriales bacterium]